MVKYRNYGWLPMILMAKILSKRMGLKYFSKLNIGKGYFLLKMVNLVLK